MDIKTRLEDDKVLFADFQSNGSRTNVLIALNKVGIYTVEDLINADASILPSASRKTYIAMAHVFKNVYLNQDLVYDVLFQKEYAVEDLNYYHRNELVNDLLRLGLVKGTSETIKRHLRRLLHDYTDNTITIEYLLKEKGINAVGPNLRRYYISYIDAKKQLEQSSQQQDTSGISINANDSSTLNSLKIQLQTLISMKQGLEQQIDTLQAQIATLEGGQISHGKK